MMLGRDGSAASARALKPKVSVVLITYNQRAFLRQSLDSVLAQTYQDFEVIVVDDASTDDTWSVAREYEQPPRVRVIRNELNKGLQRSTRNAIGLAKGDYVLWTSGDDLHLPGLLEAACRVLDRHPSVGFVHCGVRLMAGNGHLGEIKRSPGKPELDRDYVRDGLEEFAALLRGNHVATTGAVLFRRDCYDRVGGIDLTLPEASDWDLWLRMALVADVAHVATPLFCWRRHESALSVALQRNGQYYIDNLKVLDKAVSEPAAATLPWRAALARAHLDLAIHQTAMAANGAETTPASVAPAPGARARLYRAFRTAPGIFCQWSALKVAGVILVGPAWTQRVSAVRQRLQSFWQALPAGDPRPLVGHASRGDDRGPKPKYWSSVDRSPAHRAELAFISPGSRVLEIGPGPGHMTEALVKRGCRVTAVEIDPELTFHAQKVCHRLIIGNIEELDIHDELSEERFDVVILGDVLEHLKAPDALLLKLRDVLAPKGFLVVCVPNVAHGSVRLALFDGAFTYTDSGLLDRTHLRFFTLSTLASLFAGAHYEIRDLTRITEGFFDSEIRVEPASLPLSVLLRMARDPEATTYEFVFRALPLDPARNGFHNRALQLPRLTLNAARRGLAASYRRRGWMAFWNASDLAVARRCFWRGFLLSPQPKPLLYLGLSFIASWRARLRALRVPRPA